MATPDNEIIVEDADAPADDSPSVVGARSVNIVVYVLLIGLAALLGYDNWQTGAGWAPEGPQAGYFPFYLSLLLAGASLFGLFSAVGVANPSSRATSSAASCRCSFRRCCSAWPPNGSAFTSRASC
jgi:hypothetical protein